MHQVLEEECGHINIPQDLSSSYKWCSLCNHYLFLYPTVLGKGTTKAEKWVLLTMYISLSLSLSLSHLCVANI
jgi:hypothetical protein